MNSIEFEIFQVSYQHSSQQRLAFSLKFSISLTPSCLQAELPKT